MHFAVAVRQPLNEPRQAAATALASGDDTRLSPLTGAPRAANDVHLVADTGPASPVRQPVRQQRPPSSLLLVAIVDGAILRLADEFVEGQRQQTDRGGVPVRLQVARVRVVLHQQVDLPLRVVEQVDGRRRETPLDRLTDFGVDVDLIGAGLGHVIDVDQPSQLLPARRVRRLPVLLALLPEYRVLLAELLAQKRLNRNQHTNICTSISVSKLQLQCLRIGKLAAWRGWGDG